MLPPFRPALLAFDLDGTLIPEQQRHLSQDISDLLRQLSETGVKLAAITGRETVSDRIRQEGYLHATAANNGGLIHVAGQLTYEETLSQADVELLLDHGLPAMPGSPYPTALVVSRAGYSIPSHEEVSADWVQTYDIQTLTLERKQGVYKVRYSHPEAAAQAQRLRVQHPHLTVTGGVEPYLNFVAVTPRNATKGVALRRIAAELNVPLARTVAFGDSDNDADLLEPAGFAVQIGTHPHLTPHADVQLAEQTDLNSYLSQLLEQLRTPT